MIVIDTSAWIEFLRDTGSPVCNTVDHLLEGDLAICDAISMEVFAGAATSNTWFNRVASSLGPRLYR